MSLLPPIIGDCRPRKAPICHLKHITFTQINKPMLVWAGAFQADFETFAIITVTAADIGDTNALCELHNYPPNARLIPEFASASCDAAISTA